MSAETDEEKYGGLLLYTLALASLIVAGIFRLNGDLTWISKIWLICFCVSSLGFEFWFNFALAGGETMSSRRENDEMEQVLPFQIY